MAPLDQVAVSCPVGIVAGVERKMIADAVSPAVCVLGLLDVAVVMVVAEINTRVVYFNIRTVLECGEPLLCTEVRFDESLDVKSFAVELVEVVVVGIVACSKEIADPVLVVEVYVS